MRAKFRHVHPVRHRQSHPRVQAPSGEREATPRAWPIERPPSCQGTPPGTSVKLATAGLLACGCSACRRLPRSFPSGQLRQAFRLQLRGQLRNSGRSRHRIPFSLLIFEETVIFAPTKGPPRKVVNVDTDRACGSGTPVYSSERRRFPQTRDARRERGEERKLRCRGCPRNCKRRAALHSMPLEVFAPGRRKGRRGPASQ
jgi:hypothetical protein